MSPEEMAERNVAYAMAADMLKSLVDEWRAQRARIETLERALRDVGQILDGTDEYDALSVVNVALSVAQHTAECCCKNAGGKHLTLGCPACEGILASGGPSAPEPQP